MEGMSAPPRPAVAAADPDREAQRTMRSFLTAARLLSEQLGHELRREGGMSQIHYELLDWLSEAPGLRLRMNELARRTGVSASRLSHLADRLEQRGWIERAEDPGDRRALLARLTPAGRVALEEAAPWHADCARTRLLDHLSADQLRRLREISDQLSGRLTLPEPRGTPPPGP
ncbi:MULTISPECIES: MarR family winged helix-turn-helix transcriptional regulator [Streptomyces]|nr:MULTISPECIES: MarR family transcriptional regulator [Streptomyces]WTE13205.1 MarR family transcriptional regulator [Streptomyces uncialis]SCK63421.1 transcriptional regulator, MarR family [Streptomyces sp. AmelKG-E11A]